MGMIAETVFKNIVNERRMVTPVKELVRLSKDFVLRTMLAVFNPEILSNGIL